MFEKYSKQMEAELRKNKNIHIFIKQIFYA